MKRILLLAGLFNTLFGALLFFVIAATVMSFIYIADAFDWIMDPTLEPGMLPVFLLITLVLSALYYPTLIMVNLGLWKKSTVKKPVYAVFACFTLLFGLAAFYGVIYNL